MLFDCLKGVSNKTFQPMPISSCSTMPLSLKPVFIIKLEGIAPTKDLDLIMSTSHRVVSRLICWVCFIDRCCCHWKPNRQVTVFLYLIFTSDVLASRYSQNHLYHLHTINSITGSKGPLSTDLQSLHHMHGGTYAGLCIAIIECIRKCWFLRNNILENGCKV